MNKYLELIFGAIVIVGATVISTLIAFSLPSIGILFALNVFIGLEFNIENAFAIGALLWSLSVISNICLMSLKQR